MNLTLEELEDYNHMLFILMMEEVKKGYLDREWEDWQLRPEANYYMTLGTRDET